jgi:DNA-binding XRE family transcriptional regulator
MIRTDAEYRDARQRLDEDRRVIDAQRSRLTEMGLASDEVARALEPSLSFHEQLMEEVEAYEAMRRGDLAPIGTLREIGRILIGLRIAAGLTQRQLAERLEVSETQVSRDERNEYHGITVDRAQRIIEAMHGQVSIHASRAEDERELVGA